jgi:hypothetical protein
MNNVNASQVHQWYECSYCGKKTARHDNHIQHEGVCMGKAISGDDVSSRCERNTPPKVRAMPRILQRTQKVTDSKTKKLLCIQASLKGKRISVNKSNKNMSPSLNDIMTYFQENGVRLKRSKARKIVQGVVKRFAPILSEH